MQLPVLPVRKFNTWCFWNYVLGKKYLPVNIRPHGYTCARAQISSAPIYHKNNVRVFQSIDHLNINNTNRTCVQNYSTLNEKKDFPMTINKELSKAALLADLQHLCENNLIEIDRLPTYANQLLRVVYEDLFDQYPWLFKNIIVAFDQLQIMGKREESLSPVLQNPGCQMLFGVIEASVDQIPYQDCADVALAFILLGKPLHATFLNKFLNRIIDSNYKFNLASLASISDLSKMFPTGYHTILLNIVLIQLSEIISKDTVKINDDDYHLQMTDIYRILSNTVKFYKGEAFFEKITEYFLNSIKSKKYVSYADIRPCIRLINLLTHKSFEGLDKKNAQPYVRNILHLKDFVMEKLPQYFNQISGQDLRCLKVPGLTPDILLRRLDELLFKDDLPITELVHLLDSFSAFFIKTKTLDRMINVTVERIDEMDIYSLLKLPKLVLVPEVVSKFESKILENLDSVEHSLGHFHRILYIYGTTSTENSDFDNKFSAKLIELLNGQFGTNPFTVCLIAFSLLGNTKTELPDIVLERLLPALPQCPHKAFALLKTCIINKKRLEQLYPPIMDIKSAILSTLLKNNTLNSPLIVSALCNLGLLFKFNQDSSLNMILTKMLKNLPNFTKDMSQVEFHKFCYMFKVLRCYQPQVFQDMENYFFDHFSELHESQTARLVICYSVNGYKPIRYEEFSEVCQEMAIQSLKNIKLNHSLLFIFHLCQMQIFPEKVLKQLFTLEYMNHMDSLEEISSHSYQARSLRSLLYQINQCVSIECPELNIPMVCTGTDTSINTEYTLTLRRLEQALDYVLNGTQYFSSSVKSPYGHHITHECILDSHGTPLIYDSASMSATNSNIQRVAILPFLERDYCRQSHHLTGSSLMLKRHLEILGYKVVQIPYYEWKSMALTELDSQVSYLHNKIFN
ncbi:FAST kinase domain-containing protein 1, mitochondrial [Patella vulgata]|uniref:FAST kinase domain-containing protein 1, mitochondrial n=1 Tax=Patella vulgata TaxID=6465 RepID=UPI0021806AFA|nr:FAST kinase domain-containing protein 1, mitochondrial [Patella vulgata]XP_050395177.1 FAST kinase domain-containing protein 1, mitochondrial [Patella vulgata]XP_050395178.1 FAST kinase domain-containing protein 1, mitochondrial [Patella vulgata]